MKRTLFPPSPSLYLNTDILWERAYRECPWRTEVPRHGYICYGTIDDCNTYMTCSKENCVMLHFLNEINGQYKLEKGE